MANNLHIIRVPILSRTTSYWPKSRFSRSKDFVLELVHYNIRSFGGNPQKVTIFRESTGALSVNALVTRYAHSHPFRAAIEESGEVFLEGFPNTQLNHGSHLRRL